jgi:hypothetical protein
MAIYRKGDDLTPLRKKAEAQAAARNATSSKQLRKRGLTKGKSVWDSQQAVDLATARVSNDGKHLKVRGSDPKKEVTRSKITKVKMPISGSTVNKMKEYKKDMETLKTDALKSQEAKNKRKNK